STREYVLRETAAQSLAFDLRAFRYNCHNGDRHLLGQRQPVRLAGAARARIQAPALHEPPAAVLQARAQIAADAPHEPPRPGSRAQGRRLRLLRVAGHTLLPGPEISRSADLRAQSR